MTHPQHLNYSNNKLRWSRNHQVRKETETCDSSTMEKQVFGLPSFEHPCEAMVHPRKAPQAPPPSVKKMMSSSGPAGATPAGATPAGATPAGATPAGATPAGATPASRPRCYSADDVLDHDIPRTIICLRKPVQPPRSSNNNNNNNKSIPPPPPVAAAVVSPVLTPTKSSSSTRKSLLRPSLTARTSKPKFRHHRLSSSNSLSLADHSPRISAEVITSASCHSVTSRETVGVVPRAAAHRTESVPKRTTSASTTASESAVDYDDEDVDENTACLQQEQEMIELAMHLSLNNISGHSSSQMMMFSQTSLSLDGASQHSAPTTRLPPHSSASTGLLLPADDCESNLDRLEQEMLDMALAASRTRM